MLLLRLKLTNMKTFLQIIFFEKNLNRQIKINMIKNTKKSKDMFQTEGYSMTRGPSFTLSDFDFGRLTLYVWLRI